MEVIGHDAVGEYAAAGEFFAHAHEFSELLALVIFEDEPPIDDPRDAVVDGWFGGGVLPWDYPTAAVVVAHGLRGTEKGGVGKRFLIKSLASKKGGRVWVWLGLGAGEGGW